SYTRLFEWLGLGRVRRGDRCPVLDLTATPFRGVSEDETRRLVRRYNERRMDRGVLAEDPYAELQAMGVLAGVKHRLLAGSAVSLRPEELAQARQTRQLPSRVLAMLGADASRNRALLDSILGLPSDWTILLFA